MAGCVTGEACCKIAMPLRVRDGQGSLRGPRGMAGCVMGKGRYKIAMPLRRVRGKGYSLRRNFVYSVVCLIPDVPIILVHGIHKLA